MGSGAGTNGFDTSPQYECVISGFRRDVDKIDAAGGRYAAVLAINYRRFGTTYPPYLQGPRKVDFFTLAYGTDSLS